MWLILALLSGLFIAINDTLLKKYLMREVSPFLLGGSFFLIASCILFVGVALTGIPTLSKGFYLAATVTVALNILAQLMRFRSLKIGDMSLTMPLLSFTPVFLVLTSFLILGELPSLIGSLGILLVVLGTFVLYKNSLSDSPFSTFSRLWTHPGSLLMLGVAFIFSISANFDKLATVHSSPLFASAVIAFMLGSALLALGLSTSREGMTMTTVRRHWPMLFAGGALIALVMFTQNWALSLQIVPYVSAIKRTSILFSVVFGILIFKEDGLRWRFFGAAIMFIGVVLMTI